MGPSGSELLSPGWGSPFSLDPEEGEGPVSVWEVQTSYSFLMLEFDSSPALQTPRLVSHCVFKSLHVCFLPVLSH